MKILITGATGFVGTHLCEYLVQQGHVVHGTFLYQDELERFPETLKSRITLHTCDLADVEQVRHVTAQTDFEQVYHLAAMSSVHQSWKNGQESVLRVNLFGWLNLLESLHETCPDARILMVSSAEVYGIVPEDRQPVAETFPLRPINPYANSKAAQETFCYQYIHRYNSQIVMVRAFNHTGAGQSSNFVCSDFARQIAAIEQGRQHPVMSVGNLEARRDFSDVRDIVRAYSLALEYCPIGTPVNVASGSAWSIRQALDILLQHSQAVIDVQQDPARLRPSDVSLMLGDYTLLHQYTGWRPEVPFEETLQSVLEYWRTHNTATD